MLAAYTELRNAQEVKQYLLQNNLINPEYITVKELGFIYFPLVETKKKLKIPKAEVVDTKFSFSKRERKLTIQEVLKGKLTDEELKLMPKSQEIVGNIMILEVPEQLENTKKEKIIAEAYLKVNKNIETVVKKSAIHSGVFRLRKVEYLAGKKTKETIHSENGIRIKLDLEKTYFSARSANERLRVAKQIKKDEEVLVMFSGAGPFPLVFARKSLAKHIYGIEMNPLAHQYAIENVQLNKFENKISFLNGDVREILPKLDKVFDRIAMPLPKTSEEFLDVALSKSKKGTIIHLYSFLDEKEFDKETKKVKKICQDLGQPVRVLRKVKCGQFSPSVYRVCFDLKVQ